MLASIFAICWIAAPPVSLDGLTLADVHRFGVTKEAVRPLWLLSRDHARLMRPTLIGWNSGETLDQWEKECDWRRECWNQLDNVLFMDNASDQWRLQALAELRRLLGERDFWAGRMPNPTPKYRPWSD